MRRRFGADVVLAVVLPVACVLLLLVLHPDRGQPHGKAPVETALTSSSVICPTALTGTGADSLGIASLGATGSADARPSGEVQVGSGATSAPVQLQAGQVASAPAGLGPTVVTGSGALAPGLVAGRSQTAPLAAVDCAPPVTDQWFTAAGADATHDSVLELVNPNAGPAIADITVRSPSGVLDVPALRGVSVPGHGATDLDLGAVVPRRGELSVEVHTDRGRLSVHVVDTYDELGKGTRASDWLPSQAAPATSNVLLGLATGDGERTLVLANPGEDEVRATVQVLTATSSFPPAGVDTIRVPPGSTEAVSLDDVLRTATQSGATGLLVEASGPVTATLRQFVGGDLSLLSAAPSLDATTAAVVPAGTKHLLLGGPAAAGTATVTSYAANGKQLDQQQASLSPGAGGDLTLPDKAVLVQVTPDGTTVRAAVVITGTGTAVVPLRPLVLTGLVPDVRPGVP